MILSASSLIAEKRLVRMILSDLILEIVRKGLRTLRTLKELISMLFSAPMK